MALNLSLKILQDVKICGSECKEKLDNGEYVDLGSDSIVVCVGCGKKCHMECHKIPKSLVEAVKKVPKNNRVQAFFGDFSYLRVVCDNCANWLMAGLKKDEKPSFLTLFTKIAERIIKEKYILKSELVDESAPNAGSGLNARKRKKTSEDDTEGTDMMSEMMTMMRNCVDKLGKIDEKCDLNAKGNETGFSALNEAIVETQRSVNKGMIGICDKMIGMTEKMGEIGEKLESKSDVIENGIQSGFNNLFEKTEKLFSPFTPMIQSRMKNNLRKQATINAAANQFNTPRTHRFSSVVKLNNGTAADNVIFGAIVPRKLFASRAEPGGMNTQNSFQHDKAVYLRYVDPVITPRKMMLILRKNGAINTAISANENSVEITRLTKKALSEEDIRSYKFGVSYRIGATDELLDILTGGSVFATHWEIRPWVNKDRRRFNSTTNEENGLNQVDLDIDRSGFVANQAEI